jgi:hypothetical protein
MALSAAYQALQVFSICFAYVAVSNWARIMGNNMLPKQACVGGRERPARAGARFTCSRCALQLVNRSQQWQAAAFELGGSFRNPRKHKNSNAHAAHVVLHPLRSVNMLGTSLIRLGTI